MRLKGRSTDDKVENRFWGEENYVDYNFGLMKTTFVDNNIPVIIGEYDVMRRMEIDGENL